MNEIERLASRIDHTLLRVDATESELEQLCHEAFIHKFASVCMHPYWLGNLHSRHPSLRFCTVIAFPLGMQTAVAKVREVRNALLLGADELDIVVNHGQVVQKDWDSIREELDDLRSASPGKTLKLILETCRLQPDEIERLCRIAGDADFDFVKTSTGFAEAGASLDAVRLMKRSIPGRMQVKASGGIKDWSTARAMIEAGADRIGTSSGLSILKEAEIFFSTKKP